MLESNEKTLDPGLLRGLNKFKVKADNVCPLLTEDIEDPDNEFWILQCPTNVDIGNLLKDRKVSLPGNSRLKFKDKTASSPDKHVKSKKYEVVAVQKQGDDSGTNGSNDQEENLILLLPDRERQLKLALAPLSGHIIVREYIEETPLPTLIAEPKTIHQLPPGVKERHPNSWKILHSKKTKDKSKKRTHSLIEVKVEEEEEEEKFEVQEDVIPVVENIRVKDEEDDDADEPPRKKKKKIKKEVET